MPYLLSCAVLTINNNTSSTSSRPTCTSSNLIRYN